MKTFSVNKYGEEDAKRLAVEARQAVNDQLEAEWRDNYWNYRPHLINEKGYIEEPFAYEGEKKYVLHLQAERDRSIRGLKLDAFLQEHGKLFCEICSFSFEKAYGEVGKGLIEVHHLVPFSELSTGRNTGISDLMCVCSNCHLALHNGDPSENLRRLKIIFDSVTKKGANKTG
jgi:predicted HNH restriction endonuclease